jgi:hypothetical protein
MPVSTSDENPEPAEVLTNDPVTRVSALERSYCFGLLKGVCGKREFVERHKLDAVWIREIA